MFYTQEISRLVDLGDLPVGENLLENTFVQHDQPSLVSFVDQIYTAQQS
jgi:hypothetical protein